MSSPSTPATPGMTHHVVETAAGQLELVSTDRGLVRVFLPGKGRGRASTRRRLEFPDSRPAPLPRRLGRLARTLERYFDGDAVDPARVPVVFDLPRLTPFAAAIREALRTVPRGRAVSYGHLAELAGHAGAARAVGRVMASNPTPLIVPCHRVVGSGGKLTGFSSPGGLMDKQALLDLEGWDPSRLGSPDP